MAEVNRLSLNGPQERPRTEGGSLEAFRIDPAACLGLLPISGVIRSKLMPRQSDRAIDEGCDQGRSASTTRRAISSLGALLADAQEQGLTAHNAVQGAN